MLEPGDAVNLHKHLVEGNEVELEPAGVVFIPGLEQMEDLGAEFRGGIGHGQNSPVGAHLQARVEDMARAQKIME